MQTNVDEFELDNLDDFGAGSASMETDTDNASDLSQSQKDNPDDIKKSSVFEKVEDNIPDIDDLESEDDDDEDDDESEDADKGNAFTKEQSKSKNPYTGKAVSSLIKKGIIKPFVKEDGTEEKIEDYSDKDIEELIKANIEQVEDNVRSELQQNFFEEMPEEFAIAYSYFQKGGTDLKGLFRMFAENAEMFDSNVEDENDAESIARNYLHLTRFGTEDEIEEQIQEWKDLNTLSKKADNFKPKLQEVKQKEITRKLAEQEIQRKKRIQAVNKFQNDVVGALKAGELNGIKIDRKVQSNLYSGLVNLDYDSLTGRKVNLLGHLLEKYQFVEPRLDLISEALWLLQDPNGYKEKIKNIGGKEAVTETVRKLKIAEKEKIPTAVVDDEVEDKSRRLKKNFKPRSIFG
jgi:hypothetical protein